MIHFFNRSIRNTLFLLLGVLTANLYPQPVSLRSDITIKQIANVGSSSVRIKRDPATGNLYILQNNGMIRRLNFNTNGTASLTTIYTTADHGLSEPLGMTFSRDGTIYLVGIEISDSNNSYGVGTIVKGIPDSAGSEKRTWSILAKTVEYTFGHVYNHLMNGIIVDQTGKYIYVNSGACTDHGEEREGHREVGLTSIILKLPVDGKNILLQNDREWLRSNGYLFAEGIRNTFDIAYSGNNDLFGVENSDDRDDPEELNWLQEGHHYGFPWRIGGDNTPQQYTPYNPKDDPLLSTSAWGGGNLYQTYYNDPDYPPPPDSVTFTEPVKNFGPDADKFRDTLTGDPKDASDLGISVTTFSPHRSPDGLVFDRDSLLQGDLKGGGFVISLANGALLQAIGDTGGDLLLVSLTKSENEGYSAKVTRLVSNFRSPLGIELVGSKLYVLETGLWQNNNSPKLWELTLPQTLTEVNTGNYNSVPDYFTLSQNYPNPFNPVTTIKYSIPQKSFVKLEVFDILGNRIAVLVNEEKTSGNYFVTFDGSNLSSGIYYYRIEAGGFIKTGKMVEQK